MSYYLTTKLTESFTKAVERLVTALKTEGFGVLTEIDIDKVMAEKLGKSMRPYKILGACNPPFAHQVLELESKAGLMLPCNCVVQELSPGQVEISVIDPSAAMEAIGNPKLASVAAQVRAKLQTVLEKL